MKHSNFVIEGVGICAAEITDSAAGDGADAGAVPLIIAEAAAGHAGGNNAIICAMKSAGKLFACPRFVFIV